VPEHDPGMSKKMMGLLLSLVLLVGDAAPAIPTPIDPNSATLDGSYCERAVQRGRAHL